MLRHWMDYNNEAFPTNGWGAWIYTGKFDYTEENFERLENMTNALQNTMETKGFLKSASEKSLRIYPNSDTYGLLCRRQHLVDEVQRVLGRGVLLRLANCRTVR